MNMPIVRGTGGCTGQIPPIAGPTNPSTMHPIVAMAHSMLHKDPLAIASWIFPRATTLDPPGS